MALTYKEYTLNEANIDVISADVQDYLSRQKAERRNVQRIRLTLEELLLNIIGHCGSGLTVNIGIGKQFGRHILRLSYKSEPFDPIKSSDEPWSDDMMRLLGVFPSWSYRRRTNTVSLVLADRPEKSFLFYITIAVLAAILLGFAGNGFSASLRQEITDAILTPVADSFLGLMNTFSGLLIFFAICSGILGMGDAATLGKTSKSVLLNFIGMSFLISAAAVVMAVPFLKLNFSAGGQGQISTVSQISRMLFDIIPPNIIDPFRTGNALQIIVIAMFAGGGLLALGEHGERLRGLTNDSADLMKCIFSSVGVLIPIFIFAVLTRQIWSGQTSEFLSILKPTMMIVGAVLVTAAVLWIISAFKLKCSPLLLMKKVFPAFLLAFTTASSVATMPLGMETCEKKLGIKGNMVSFMYPLGSVIYMPSSVAYFTVLVCSMAEIYQVEVSVSWFVTAFVISTLIAIAMPPIPLADILGFTILFSSLGIPSEALVLVTALSVLFDFIDTAFNVMLMMFHITCEAERLGSLDRETLLSQS